MPSENSIAASGATVPPGSSRPLRRRVVSALVLVPAALLAAVLGTPFWDIFVALFGTVMAWEWSRICSGRSQPGLAGIILMTAVPAAIAAAAFGTYWAAFLILFAGAAGTAIAARLGQVPAPGWQGLGVLYVGVPCIAIQWIRVGEAGLETLLWLLVLVWAVDTAAFLAGRRFGGPKLAPRISPNKTWAGLGGGVLAAALVGLVAAVWLESPSVWPLVAISAGLGLVEQAGDLAESAVKRRFGVKDSSAVIPGHGGVLDRVDGLMAVAVAVATLSLAGSGSVLLWR